MTDTDMMALLQGCSLSQFNSLTRWVHANHGTDDRCSVYWIVSTVEDRYPGGLYQFILDDMRTLDTDDQL